MPGNHKPTKREPNTGRLINTRPQNDKPFRTFLDAIPRDMLEGALAAQPEESNLRTLLALMNADFPGPHKPLLVTLCRKAGVSMNQIMNLMKDTAIAEGTVRMFTALPQVMEDVGQDAKTRTRTCSVCMGVGSVVIDAEVEGTKRFCLNCEGTGKVREIGDRHARDLLFETAELTNRKVPLINQNFDLRSNSGLKEVMMATQDLLEPGGKR